MATHSSVLALRIPGTGDLVGCRLWGRTESDSTEATQQQQQQHVTVAIWPSTSPGGLFSIYSIARRYGSVYYLWTLRRT